MKYLKRYNESNSGDIDTICKKYGIKNYTINPDDSIDVDGDVDLRGSRFWDHFRSSNILTRYRSTELQTNNWTLDRLPFYFGKVSGTFDCRYNNLTSLEGCPKEVGGDFYISDNLLTSLVGCPNEVRRFLGGDNLFSDLTGCPQVVNGDFNVSNNKNLVSLKGGPKEVKCYYSFSGSGLLDPSGFENRLMSQIDDFSKQRSITFKDTPFCNVLNIFLSKNFGLNCECRDLNNCNHPKDNEYIYQMIRTIIDMGIINGNEIYLDKLYMLYYDLLDEGVINVIEGEFDLPGYVLV
jgi:hypothetical protein